MLVSPPSNKSSSLSCVFFFSRFLFFLWVTTRRPLSINFLDPPLVTMVVSFKTIPFMSFCPLKGLLTKALVLTHPSKKGLPKEKTVTFWKHVPSCCLSFPSYLWGTIYSYRSSSYQLNVLPCPPPPDPPQMSQRSLIPLPSHPWYSLPGVQVYCIHS